MKQEEQWTTNYKSVTMKLSDGSLVKGKVNIGENKRLSTLFKTSPEYFIPVITNSAGDDSIKILIVNKNNIVWVEAED